ncbi:hypothetical protein, partial [Leifsonia shinshuensis]|uniref:hypothetical protein n=1 Tax=Leifsonia shinshuensis TaxID=150026 RepID=UPI0035E9CFBF
EVIALKGGSYEGLMGYIEEILILDERITENDCLLDIVVTFEETFNMDITHPHLNGTTVSKVIVGEDDLGFYVHDRDELAETIEGKAVCPSCFAPLDNVIEIQHDVIEWDWDSATQSYQKSDQGSSDGKECGYCDGRIYDEMQHRTFFKY